MRARRRAASRVLRASGWVALAVTVGVSGRAVAAGEPRATPPSVVAFDDDAPFDPTNRRDPFRPPRATVASAGGEPRTPLQRYDLGQLRLVAVIYKASEPRAVVEDDEGLGYIVKVGTPIGANGGTVRRIDRGKVLIQENSYDFYGERRVTDVVMELRTAEGGNQ